MKQKIKRAAAWFGDSSGNVKLSMVIMGAGPLWRKGKRRVLFPVGSPDDLLYGNARVS